MQEQKLRIAIVNKEKCKPKKCKQECKKACPVNKTEKICIEVTPQSAFVDISEILCIGCGLCVKRCPFQAIRIINLPKNMERNTTHRYGNNTFKLHRLPTPRPGQVLGLVGTNGIGKSTALQILSGKMKPNLGMYDKPPEWEQILKYFKGSELQNYLTKLLENNLKAITKLQYVDEIPKRIQGKVGQIIQQKDAIGKSEELKYDFQLAHLYDRDVKQLSGGELQRFATMIVCISKAQVYIFDEPSTYLDVKQRLKSAKLIRSLQTSQNYIIVVEHDLSVLDYLSDFICVLYGQPSAYGVVTMPFSVREGINVFLAGFVPTENMRFREVELNFKIVDNLEEVKLDKMGEYKYGKMQKKLGDFELQIEEGSFRSSQIIVMLGENGTGKTTFITMLAGAQNEAAGSNNDIPEMNVSYKPQKIKPTFEGTVRELLTKRFKDLWMHPQFNTDVAKPLKLEDIIDNDVLTLSGGQLQRVALILALCKPADVYLIDEPSAFLDAEQRVLVARLIKRFIINAKKAAFIVEHDFIMSSYLADLVIVYEGTPGKKCKANSPQSLVSGMNKFLSILGITFRRDSTNFRPRINKIDSILDKEQKLTGNYFCLDE